MSRRIAGSRRSVHDQGVSTLNRLLEGEVVEGAVVRQIRWPGPGTRPVVTTDRGTLDVSVPVLQDYAMLHLGYEPHYSGRDRSEFELERQPRPRRRRGE